MFDVLPASNCFGIPLLLNLDIALQQAGADTLAIFLQRRPQMISRRIQTRADQIGRRQLAIIFGDLLVRRDIGQLGGNGNRLFPIFLQLVDFQQIMLGLFGHIGTA